MPFFLLLFLTLACLEDEWSTGYWIESPGLSAAITWTATSFWIGLAALLSLKLRRRLLKDPSQRESVLRRYGSWRFYHTIGLFALYAVLLYGVGWSSVVRRVTGSGTALVPGGELLVLLPFLAGLILSWWCFYDAERAIHDSSTRAGEAFWSRWAYLSYHIRTNLVLVFVWILLLIVPRTVARAFPEVDADGAEPWWHSASLLSAVAMLICMPWILRLALGLKPLPDNSTRQRLLGVAQRLRFRCSNILQWDTRGGVANAMVAGVCPWPRYVTLTDKLVAELTPEEVDAVFGHEVGHVKHYHMPYYAGFLLVSFSVLWLAAILIWPNLQSLHNLAAFPMVALLGAYIFLVFGFLSRRCERQADIYGCRAISCGRADCSGHDENTAYVANGRGLCPTGIRTFISALEKVARLNGISRDKPGILQSWLHSTIARRVDFLQRMLNDDTLEPRFQRKVGLVKWALILGLSAALVVLAAV